VRNVQAIDDFGHEDLAPLMLFYQYLVQLEVSCYSIYRVTYKSLSGFARSYLGNPWYYRNDLGAKRCVSSLSFVWTFENVDYLNFFC
jgi:hypothetical protein